MARKTTNKTTKTTGPKTVMEDNYVAPKKGRKPKAEEQTVTLAEALAESGETMEELKAESAKRPAFERPIGMSNLASTIRSHRASYTTMLRGDKKTQNNGDPVAQMLLPIPLEALKAFSTFRYSRSYDHLNPGHARMCIGNLIRADVKKGEAGVLEWLQARQPVAESAE